MHDRRADQHPHGREVVGGAGHQVAGALLLVVAERERLEMPVEVVAHVVFDPARRADDDPALGVEEQALHRCRGHVGKSVADEGRARGSRRQPVHRPPDDGRLDQREDGRAHDAEPSRQEGPPVTGEVAQESFEWRHTNDEAERRTANLNCSAAGCVLLTANRGALRECRQQPSTSCRFLDWATYGSSLTKREPASAPILMHEGIRRSESNYG